MLHHCMICIRSGLLKISLCWKTCDGSCKMVLLPRNFGSNKNLSSPINVSFKTSHFSCWNWNHSMSMQLSQGKLQILYSNEVNLEFLKLIIAMYVNEVWLMFELISWITNWIPFRIILTHILPFSAISSFLDEKEIPIDERKIPSIASEDDWDHIVKVIRFV